MLEPTDQNLLAAARGGDTDALEELLLRYQPHVYRFGMKMCGDAEDAKDVLQETLLAMARGVREFRGAASLSTWLYTVARSFCLKKRRRSKFAPASSESLDAIHAADQVADPRPDPEAIASSRQVDAVLTRAIASLEPAAREVLVLRDIEGLSAPEVAEVVGASVEAVKSRLHRARLALRHEVLRDLGSADDTARPAEGTCPDVLTLFSRHLEGEITADLCAEMERHLDQCGRCRGACDSLKQTLSMCHNAPQPRVPAAVQQSVRDSLRRLIDSQPSR